MEPNPFDDSEIRITTNVAAHAAEWLCEHFSAMLDCADCNVILVCDVNTHKALGDALYHALANHVPCKMCLFEGTLKADDKALARLKQNSKQGDLLLAIGSGTINDLCKYVSYERGDAYACFPTAPSMNGYISANASLTIAGVKSTLPPMRRARCILIWIYYAPRHSA